MIDKSYFDKIGKYDMLMDIWGGENLGNHHRVYIKPLLRILVVQTGEMDN